MTDSQKVTQAIETMCDEAGFSRQAAAENLSDPVAIWIEFPNNGDRDQLRSDQIAFIREDIVGTDYSDEDVWEGICRFVVENSGVSNVLAQQWEAQYA